MRFRNYFINNFPFLENDFDAMTDYELFCKMIGYMKKMSVQFNDFQIKLNKYENYFNNLDVQEEIDNKLDEMYENGELANLVSEFLALKSTFVYDSVSDLKLAENLADGCTARTLGYNEKFDGGAGMYYITEKQESDVIDDIFILSLYNENLVAILMIEENEVNVKQAGLTGDVSEDATDKLAILFASGYDLYFPSGTYNTTNQLNLTCHKLKGENSNVSIIKFNNENNNQLIECTGINKLDIIDLCFDCGSANDTVKTSINLYSSSNIKILNCEFKNGYGGHLRLNGSDNVLIEDCYFHDISGDISNMGNAIYCHPTTNLTINRCKCNNIMEDFLYLDGGSDENPVKNVMITNCYLKNTSHNNPTLVSNCIGINGACDNVTVANCILTNNGAGLRCQGRYGTMPSNVFIYGNRICDNIQNGMNITANNIFIYDNIVYNCPQDGMYVLSSTNVHLNNNVVYNSGRNGIWIRGGNYISITDSRIYNNYSCGLSLGTTEDYATNHVSISNCDIYATDDGTQTTGIQMLYGDDYKILSCHAYNNTADWDVNRAGITNYVSQLNPNRTTSVVKSLTYASGIPSSGTYATGDIVLFTSPTAGGYIGAVCVSGGTQGTWKYFGNIQS